MPEHIKKDLALSVIRAAKDELVADYAYAAASILETFVDRVRELPAADVVEVVHAHIVTNWLGDCHCSNCGEYADCTKPYCASCGARLDEPETREE